MPVRICKHGNSLSIRIGAHIARTIHLKAGDFVHVRLLDNGDIRVRPVKGVVPVDSDATSERTHEEKAPAEEQW